MIKTTIKKDTTRLH